MNGRILVFGMRTHAVGQSICTDDCSVFKRQQAATS